MIPNVSKLLKIFRSIAASPGKALRWKSNGELENCDVVLEGDERLTDARAPLAHDHQLEDVTGLPDALQELDTLIAQKAAGNHGHQISDVADLPETLTDLASGVSANAEAVATKAERADLVSLAETVAALPTGSQDVTWSLIQDKPATYPPSAHNHTTAQVTGLDAALGAKANQADLTSLSGTVTSQGTALAGKADKADVTALTTTVAGKANAAHTHAEADIVGLTDQFDAVTAEIDAIDDRVTILENTPGGPGAGGDMTKAEYASATPGVVNHAAQSDAAPWAGVTGKPASFTPAAHTHSEADVTDLSLHLDGKSNVGHDHNAAYEPKNANIQAHITSTLNPHGVTVEQIGAIASSAIGVLLATLGVDGKLDPSQIPAALLGQMAFQTMWNASTNTPALPAPVAATKGQYWVVNVAGTRAMNGVPSSDWQVGDWIVSAGDGSWLKLDNTDAIVSFAGRTGAITPQAGDYSLDLVGDTATRVAVTPAQKAQIHDATVIGTHAVDEAGLSDFNSYVYDAASGKHVMPAANIDFAQDSTTPSITGKALIYSFAGYTVPGTIVTNIGGGVDGQVIFVRGSNKVTLHHDATAVNGNMRLTGSADYTFGSSNEYIWLKRIAGIWMECARSTAPPHTHSQFGQVGTKAVLESNIADWSFPTYDSANSRFIYNQSIQTLTANSTTPSIGRYNQFTLGAYTQATVITTFLNMPESVPVFIRGSSYVTLKYDVNVLRLAGNKDYTFGSSSDYIILMRFGTVIFEVARSNQAGLMTAKGDILVGLSAGQGSCLALGTDGQVLTVDTSRAQGVKWATPAASSGGPATGSFIDYNAAQVNITDATGIPAVGVVNNLGATAGAYTVAMPSAATTTGKIIEFRVTNTSTSPVTLNSGTDLIDGLATRVLWRGEVCQLVSNGVTWTKIGGKTNALSGTMYLGTNQIVAAATNAVVNVDTALTPCPGVSTFADTTNHYFKAPRPGNYRVSCGISTNSNPTSIGAIRLFYVLNGSFQMVAYHNNSNAVYTVSDTLSWSAVLTLAAGDTVAVGFWREAGTTATTSFNNNCMKAQFISVDEVPTW